MASSIYKFTRKQYKNLNFFYLPERLGTPIKSFFPFDWKRIYLLPVLDKIETIYIENTKHRNLCILYKNCKLIEQEVVFVFATTDENISLEELKKANQTLKLYLENGENINT